MSAKTLRESMTLLRVVTFKKFGADAILFREIQCKKRTILMFKRRFQCGLCWSHVKHLRITITHVGFIALALAGPSDDILTLGLMATCSNSFLRTQQMLMHEKNMRDPYKFSNVTK